MGEPYPFSQDTQYELTGDGRVRVTQFDKEGFFRWDGAWLSGELRYADPQMCIWVAGWNGWRSGPDAAARLTLTPRPASAKS